jgi:protein-disulfide isomerase
MKHTKKTTHHHHVEAKKECACGENCKCGCNCGCSAAKAVILGGTALALIMSGLALWKVNSGCEEKFKKFVEANPTVIIESVNKHYEQMEKERAKPTPKVAPAELVKEIVNDKTNYSLGNPKGKFVIIEFFDHQCGWCKKTNVEMSKVVASAEGKNIRWIPVDTPIFGEASETIARFVLAAGKQGKYAQMHEAVTNAKGKLDEAALIELGKGLGLDTKKLKADADGKAIRAKLTANKEYAKKLNINGVPMLIVDGQINPGALLGDKLQEAVKASQSKK